MTLPLVVILALVIGAVSGGGGPDSTANPTSGALPALTPSAPPHGAAEAAPCAKVLAQLPVQLGRLNQRVVHPVPDSPYVVAWGEPPIVLSCGVDRPKDLKAGSDAVYVDGGDIAGPYYDVTRNGSANVYTTVDRAAYISITVPGKYPADTPVAELSQLIAKALPAVCTTDPNEPDVSKLCTRRKS